MMWTKSQKRIFRFIDNVIYTIYYNIKLGFELLLIYQANFITVKYKRRLWKCMV